jgi:hypothetical protein
MNASPENTEGGGTEEFSIRPTVIMRHAYEEVGEYTEERAYLVTAECETEREALIVFRNPEDARKFQEDAGKYSADEGFKLIGMSEKAIAAVLKKWGIRWVHMPKKWGSDDEVWTFEGESFVRMLEESRV